MGGLNDGSWPGMKWPRDQGEGPSINKDLPRPRPQPPAAEVQAVWGECRRKCCLGERTKREKRGRMMGRSGWGGRQLAKESGQAGGRER